MEGAEKIAWAFFESVREALFDLQDSVVEVCLDEWVVIATHDGNKEGQLAFADESVVVIGEVEDGDQLTKVVAAVFEESFEVGLDSADAAMSRWVIASVGDELVGAAPEEKNFHDLVSASALEYDVVEAAAGEKGFEAPSEFVAGANAGKILAGFHLLGEGTADGVPQHRF